MRPPQKDAYTIVGLGEILWDMLPAGKQLGGAPTNFAHHVQMLGDVGLIASRIGADDLGREILARLEELQLSDDYLQRDPDHPTGVVDVQLDDHGQPTYVIHENVAWDFFAWSDSWQGLAQRADAVCFGSLAQRNDASRQAIHRFLEAMRPDAVRVCDINLRQNFYNKDILVDSLRRADVVKLNEAELAELLTVTDLKGPDTVRSAYNLMSAYDVTLMCVTRGREGAILVTTDETVSQDGFVVEVADTVGAGDAFTAGLLYQYLRARPLLRIAEAANQLGAFVASKPGGTCILDEQTRRRVTAGV